MPNREGNFRLTASSLFSLQIMFMEKTWLFHALFFAYDCLLCFVIGLSSLAVGTKEIRKKSTREIKKSMR